MFGKKRLHEVQRRQYVDDLILLSGGLPGKGFVEHFGFYTVFFANAIGYTPGRAHAVAEEMRASSNRWRAEMEARQNVPIHVVYSNFLFPETLGSRRTS